MLTSGEVWRRGEPIEPAMGQAAVAEGAQRGRCSRLEREENGAGMSAVRCW
jgi:hypothetical protein